MKATSTIMYCITFLVYSIFFGGIYSNFNLTYHTSLIILIVISIIMAGALVFDYFFYDRLFKKPAEEISKNSVKTK